MDLVPVRRAPIRRAPAQGLLQVALHLEVVGHLSRAAKGYGQVSSVSSHHMKARKTMQD